MKSFFIKTHVRFFTFKFDLNVKYRPYFSNKGYNLQKKRFSIDYVKVDELHVVNTWRHMQRG